MVQFNVDYFNKIDTEQKAYILGFLQADGSFSCKGRISGFYRYKLTIQEGDKEIILKIQECMDHTGLLTTQKSNVPKRQGIVELSLNGIVFAESMREIFGGYKKDERINFPLLPSRLLRHYLRGVADADGSMGDYNGLMIRISGKKSFLESVRDVSGFRFYISKGHGKTTYTLGATGEEAINVIEWLYSDLSPDSLFLERKRELASNLLNNRGVQMKGVA